jgi:hypothetical protein
MRFALKGHGYQACPELIEESRKSANSNAALFAEGLKLLKIYFLWRHG